MPGDYSRKTFNRKKHYRAVLMEQGRVQVDADWNEQLDLQLYRTETETRDVIGLCGVPKEDDGFKITVAGQDLQIAPGRFYAGGLLCELDKAATYTTQPYYPNPEFVVPFGSPLSSPLTSPLSSPPTGPKLALNDGVYLVYLDAWHREITALDDPMIREKALGGPDTATRLQTVWQAKLLRITTNNGDVKCKSSLPEFADSTAEGTGKLNARTEPADDPKNPCLLPPQAGYLLLENQLYRVEVHNGGDRNAATFTWSRDNATVESRVEKVNGSVVTVSEIGKDEVLAFHAGEWVELVTEEATLKRTRLPLIQIEQVDPATREVRLKTSVPSQAQGPTLKLRRWDQSGSNAGASGVSMTLGNWIDLEGGIEVNFSGGTYRPGDYWLIPARTTTGEIEWPPFQIPNTNPIAQSPVGVRHHYCRLALIEAKSGVIQVKEDCRDRFPSLTEICAEDVCFDNGNCKLHGAETVQDALDKLCAARDLRHHNKHLHGWGIVCGLQVRCGPDTTGQPRRHVTVRKGYAIDCEGNDVIVEKDHQLDLVAMVSSLSSPPASPPSSPPVGLTDGELALVLELDARQGYRFLLERYTPPKNDFQSLFQGTLLADFINNCILSLKDFFIDEFTAGSDEVKTPVGPARKRMTTLLNLIVQLVNPTNGSFVFISREEDKILREFYAKLRDRLRSNTFCALFDGARPFPKTYPFPNQDIVTIFGKGGQQKLRIAPNGNVGYAVGARTNKIAVYDLKKNVMAEELVFPGGTNAFVEDVAFSRDGRQLFAIGTLNAKDTAFAVADVSGLKHVWRNPTVICDVELLSLAAVPSISADVFAIGKGKGLYQINPLNVNATPTPILAFNASGHMDVFAQEGIAFAGAAAPGAVPTRYDRIVRVNLKSPANSPAPIPLSTVGGQQLSGEDHIALAVGGQAVKLYVVINPPPGFTTKHVLIFEAGTGKLLGQRNLGEGNTDIRLVFSPATKRMVVSFEESYRLAVLNADDEVESKFRFPVQISPISLAVSPNGEHLYALNHASNTISSIQANLLDPQRQLSMKDLVDYRTAVLNAFFDLAGGFFQYLKDCLCDHFLVNCPTCDTDDKIYLAVISIRNREVRQVCNFSMRKYVKSFPLVEYCLSLVPIIPLVKKLVEQFCCAVLPSFFGRQTAPQPAVIGSDIIIADNRVKSKSVRSSVDFVQATDFRAAIADSLSKVTSGGTLFADILTQGAKTRLTGPQVLRHTDIANQPIEEATRRLKEANIEVASIEPYDREAGLANLIEFTRAPVRLEKGMKIKLIMKEGKVLYYTKVAATPRGRVSAIDEADDELSLRAELNALQEEMLVLRDQVAKLSAVKVTRGVKRKEKLKE